MIAPYSDKVCFHSLFFRATSEHPRPKRRSNENILGIIEGRALECTQLEEEAVRLSAPRIGPIADLSSIPKEEQELLSRSAIPPTVNVFRTLIRHPKLFKRWIVFANHILFKSTLSQRDRELLILRTGWRCRAEYEWGQHVLVARKSGISDDEIYRITQGPEVPGWDPFDAALLRAADELHDDNFVSDATWSTLAARYTTQQLMDAVFVVGQYTLVSMALNTFGVQLDAGVNGFPS